MFFDSKECEWSDQRVFLNGIEIGKIRGIKFKKSVEKDLLYASGKKALSIQHGNERIDGTLTVLKGTLEDINRSVQATGGEDVTDAEFVITVSFVAKGTRAVQNYNLIGVEIAEFEVGMMQNDKFNEINLPFIGLRHSTV